jgi:hypothetical protein
MLSAISIAIRTGSNQGVPLSKRDRQLMLDGAWISPVYLQFFLFVTMAWFDFEVASETVSDGARSLAYFCSFVFGLGTVATVGFGADEAIAMRAELRRVDAPHGTGKKI